MKAGYFLIAVMGTSLLLGKEAAAQRYMEQCGQLLRVTETTNLNDLTFQYAYLRTRTENLSQEQKNDFRITVPVKGVPVSLNFDATQKRIQELSELTQTTYRRDQQFGRLAAGVLTNAQDRYLDCVKSVLGQQGKVAVQVTQATDTYVRLRIFVGEQRGNNVSRRLVLLSNGRFAQTPTLTLGGASAERSVIINRRNPGRDLIFSVALMQGNAELDSDEATIPPIVSVQEQRENLPTRSIPIPRATCGQNKDGYNITNGQTVSIRATGDEILDHVNATAIVVKAGGDQNVEPHYEEGERMSSELHSGMRYVVRDERQVSARAHCAVHASESVFIEGELSVPVYRIRINRVGLPDNGQNVEELRPPRG